MSTRNTMEKIRNALKKSGSAQSLQEGKAGSSLWEGVVSLPNALLYYVAKAVFGDTVCSWVLEFMNWGFFLVQQHCFHVPPFIINHLPLAAGCITTLLIGGALNSVVSVCKWGVRKFCS